MVLLKFFRPEQKGVHHAALLLALMSAANGLLGVMRDRLLAGTYGASRELDIYYAAFRVPDLIFSLSLFFVASTAFIPLFLENRKHSERDAKDFFDGVFTTAVLVVGVCIALAYIVLPYVMRFVAPGFSQESQTETLLLSRIMLFSPLFLALSNLLSGVLQSSKQFLVYALSPLVYNIGIIAGVLFFAPLLGPVGLACGVVLGALLHVGVQVPALLRLGFRPAFRISQIRHSRAIVRYSFPRAVALSWNQITFFILISIASLLGVGAVSVFNLSYNLHVLPMVVIGLSYSVAAFPTMAESVLQNRKEVFFEHLVSASRHIVFWTVPIAAVMIVLRAHIVRLVLGTGAFAWLDTRLTAASLLLLAVAIVFQSLITLFVRAYYALGLVRAPIICNIIGSIVTVGIASFATSEMVSGEGFLGAFVASVFRLDSLFPESRIAVVAFLSLPFAYLVGSIINALMLGYGLFHLNGTEARKEFLHSARAIVLVAAFMGITARVALGAFNFLTLDTTIGVLFHAGFAGLAALASGVLACQTFGVREFVEIREALRTRLMGEGDVYQPDTEHL